ncbi:sugar phosphate isomerase/epimerase family protein [Cohnella nanjingensis]|uniref:TIM barrel protein n=1 Tax=Cohnella nanjingensis TaxID=1387779 RepID=A0A7X0RX99_9BACL|nr:TIM barrel protein [Cohnella nanjingensis]MBB6675362.1 TIM barrel protein [Cohnella nanjingensis]
MQCHVNSWSFDRIMGPTQVIEWDEAEEKHVVKTEPADEPARLALPELIAKLGEQGYLGVELAYVHLRDTSEDGLRRLRADAERAGVALTSLLLDFGDASTASEPRRRAEEALYRRWIRSAEQAGFRRVRIGAGDAPPGDEAALARAAEMLTGLAGFAGRAGIRLVTENLGRLLSRSEAVLKLLKACGGEVGLTADFGNFKDDKYRQLKEILPQAETIHAKASEDGGGQLDSTDFRKCADLARHAGFHGPFSLTYLGEGDPWRKLSEIRDLAAIEPTSLKLL